MKFLRLLTSRSSAPVARERLQILLAHERAVLGRGSGGPDLVSVLREEILAVIAKHVTLDADKMKVTIERGEGIATLEVEVELPAAQPLAMAS